MLGLSSLDSQLSFLEEFIQSRDVVEGKYYAKTDSQLTDSGRMWRFLQAMINPLIGRPVRDAEDFYATYGRLMHHCWLSLSLGIYNEQVQCLESPIQRLHCAQVNTVDITWHPLVQQIQAIYPEGGGILLEVGSGRGNSIARVAQQLKNTRIITITISPEQQEIVQAVAEEMMLPNVEVRLGNILDPALTADLRGQVDGVGSIEVICHLQGQQKWDGIKLMADLLKPGGRLSIVDGEVTGKLSQFLHNYYANQSCYLNGCEDVVHAFENAQIKLEHRHNYIDGVFPTFADSTLVLKEKRDILKKEFGSIVSWLWPQVPQIYSSTMREMGYMHSWGTRLAT